MSDLVKSIISGFNENYDNLEKSNIESFSKKILKNNIKYNDINKIYIINEICSVILWGLEYL